MRGKPRLIEQLLSFEIKPMNEVPMPVGGIDLNEYDEESDWIPEFMEDEEIH